MSAPNLQRIASALNAPLDDIARPPDAAEPRAEAGKDDVARPGGPSPLSLTKLDRTPDFVHRLMQADKLSFEYDVDPDEADAELIAEMVGLMKYFAVKVSGKSWAEFVDFRSVDEERIRRMGRMNSRRRALAERGIHVFWGDFIDVGNDEVAEGAMQRRFLVVLFSSRTSESAVVSVNRGLSQAEAEALEREYAARKAARDKAEAAGGPSAAAPERRPPGAVATLHSAPRPSPRGVADLGATPPRPAPARG